MTNSIIQLVSFLAMVIVLQTILSGKGKFLQTKTQTILQTLLVVGAGAVVFFFFIYNSDSQVRDMKSLEPSYNQVSNNHRIVHYEASEIEEYTNSTTLKTKTGRNLHIPTINLNRHLSSVVDIEATDHKSYYVVIHVEKASLLGDVAFPYLVADVMSERELTKLKELMKE